MNELSRIFLTIALSFLLAFAGHANPGADSTRLLPFINLSGYIKSDFIFDSRQNFSFRENMLLLYPMPELADENGLDINDVRNIQFVPFQTRLTVRFSGTEVMRARVSGLMEGEFFGSTDMDMNGLRLRHASITLDWNSGFSLLLGQFWHPFFVTECFPTTANINTGIPFNPFSRNPQLELSYKSDNIRLSFAALSQIDFKSTGPDGVAASYLRNGGLPEFAGKIYFTSDNKDFLIGAATSYKQLRPRLADGLGNKVNEKIASTSFMGFAKYSGKSSTIKIAGIYGQDLHHLTMLGGYAVRSSNNYSQLDIFNQKLYYTPVTTFSAWGEYITGEIWQLGIFGGYSENLGAKDEINISGNEPIFYSRGSDINYLFRLSPRISYIMNNIRLGAETEFTSAAYLKSYDSRGKPTGSEPAGNLRVLLFVFYYF